jgi:nicotinate dehydrogenase subunit B
LPEPSRRQNPRIAAILLALLGLLALAAVLLVALGWHSQLAPVALPERASFDLQRVRQGEELAALANCAGCHTAGGGRSLAGGVAVATPFGAI